MDLACGDPHPGNYLLCADGRVAFADFGMMRRLPTNYLRREAAVARAVRDDDPEGLVTGSAGAAMTPRASATRRCDG